MSQTTAAPDQRRYFTWQRFVNNFGQEMASAEDVYHNMKRGGLVDFAYAVFDFDFESDAASKLRDLADFLETHYAYSDLTIQEAEQQWVLKGITGPLPVTEEILLYWALDLYKRGYEYDCRLRGYGAMIDKNNLHFPDWNPSSKDTYFKTGESCYHKGDLSGALINWTLCIQLDPEDVDAYYSRAIVKDELYTWKSALRDYDKAIALAPDFVSAYNNRGALKDDNRDHQGAIQDYNKAIELAGADLKNLQIAYFNRGNSKQQLDDLSGACSDWKTALELGADYAEAKIRQYCG